MKPRQGMSVPTTTMVCFEAGDTAYGLPLQHVRSVRVSDDLVALPDPARDVVGIVPGDPPLTVISPLQDRGRHIVVVEAGGRTFGLLVGMVTGLRQIADRDIRPAPEGQGRPLVSGTVEEDGRLLLLTDPIALSERL